MKSILLIIPIWIFLATACDPCEECGEPLNFEPTVELVFINNDTLVGINEEITQVLESISGVETGEDQVEEVLDSLEARLVEVNELIDEGNTELEEERMTLEDLIITYMDSTEYYEMVLDEMDSVRVFWNGLRQDVLSGLLKVDTLYVNGQYITYEDSSESYQAPLLMNEEAFTQFEIIIREYSGEISFEYELVESVDATREIKLRARNITPVNNHTFDSISEPQCQTSECLDHETTVYIYF